VIFLDLSDLTGDPRPVSLRAFLDDNEETGFDSRTLAALHSMEPGDVLDLDVGGGVVTVRRVAL